MSSIQQSTEKKKSDVKKQQGSISPTKKNIQTQKDTYCSSLTSLVGNLTTAEENVNGLAVVYEIKKCSFIKTEKNYRTTRNLEIQTGVELVQASTEIKSAVKAAIAKNDELVKALKAICAATKDAKTKFGELRAAADMLDSCRKDSCNASQMIKLGCKPSGDCNDNTKRQDTDQENTVPKACENACSILDHLVSIPATLTRDIDIIFNSSAEIVGIQSFTNIKTIDKFQQDFELNIKSFDDWVALKMKDGKTAVDASQTELTDSIKSLTTGSYVLYNNRNAVETADATKDYLCYHKCKCLNDEDECGCNDLENMDERLKNCKCDICTICDEVTAIYCDSAPKDNCAD